MQSATLIKTPSFRVRARVATLFFCRYVASRVCDSVTVCVSSSVVVITGWTTTSSSSNQIKSNQLATKLATKLANNHGWYWRREETNDETVVRTGDAIDETGTKRDV